ncbi:hypothetical protein DXG01_002975 [Tephrocybe rancida]|nr:hypothetical protein DXG01_002975 [Tephrocybe rancida]
MAKRKAESADLVVEDEEQQKNKNLKEESESDYAPKEEEEEVEELEEDEPLSKKPKTNKTVAKKSDTSSSGIAVKTTSEGDKYVDLGKKKRATVRSFKGTPLIDIREFYGNDGEEKPGKKGISLTLDQWEILKKSTDVLDELFATVKK